MFEHRNHSFWGSLVQLMGFLAAWLFLMSPSATAQCTHNPTVTPNNLIFCPSGGFDTLWTQNYQGYQWFKDGVLQVGDTLRYRRVTHLDAGSMFSVDATLNGCTERSPQVMVDGWVFLLPVVATDGLRFPLCIGDTLRLRLLPPYTMHIQWTNGGVPIPGATDDTLIVTTDGDYSVSGAPELCPAFLQQLGVTLSYRFVPCPNSINENASALGLGPFWYPNPLVGKHLYLRGEIPAKNLAVKIQDAMGRCLQEEVLPAGSSVLEWKAGELPGLYTVVWHDGQRTRTQRLAVQAR